MQNLKPLCEACGTPNPMDSEYCLECGIKFKNNEEINFDENGMRRDVDGKFIIKDEADNTTVLFEETNERVKTIMKAMNIDPNNKCTHKTVVNNHQCECVRCIDCDTRTETCFEHTPKFDYGLQTKKKNSLDHLKETLSPKTPFPEDKRLDFRSYQIPNWEFPKPKKQFIVENDEDIAKHGRIEGRNVLKIDAHNIDESMEIGKDIWNNLPSIPTETMQPPFQGIIKVPDATPEEMRRLTKIMQIEMAKVAEDPNYSPLMITNKDIEIVPFSPITGTDVRKGIPPKETVPWDKRGWRKINPPKIPKQKPEPTQIPITSGLNRPFPVKHIRVWGGKGKCDCDGIKSICDEFRAKQEERPYSAIIGTDVRKGITGFSRIEKFVLEFCSLAIIISLGILIYL